MSQSKHLSSSFPVSASFQACNQKIMRCQSFSITVHAAQFLSRCGFWNVWCSLCEQTETTSWLLSPLSAAVNVLVAMTRKEKNTETIFFCCCCFKGMFVLSVFSFSHMKRLQFSKDVEPSRKTPCELWNYLCVFLRLSQPCSAGNKESSLTAWCW